MCEQSPISMFQIVDLGIMDISATESTNGMWVSLRGLVEVAWCLSRIPSGYYGAPRRPHRPSQDAAGSSADGGSAANYSNASAASS